MLTHTAGGVSEHYINIMRIIATVHLRNIVTANCMRVACYMHQCIYCPSAGGYVPFPQKTLLGTSHGVLLEAYCSYIVRVH